MTTEEWILLVFVLLVVVILVLWLISASYRIAKEWERMPVLRFGKFMAMRGPGLFFVVPMMDKIPFVVDIRTIPMDVQPQRALTKDNIPVTVDGVIFYKVLDPKKAVFTVKDYGTAIWLAATPMLRDVIGKMTLDELLQRRDEVAGIIQTTLAKMTGPWGIVVENVEIRDITTSKDLEDAISRVAAAERERRARAQLAMAEKEIAQTLMEAAKTYERDPVALSIRSMNMLYEMCMQGKATTIFVPTETALQMRSPVGAFGIVGMLGKDGDIKKETTQ
jgi:regulator of protease activity HflC (stomatin/prohibitin superfamily)